MGVLGQVTFTFKINDKPFTQLFIVCRHMTRHMISFMAILGHFLGRHALDTPCLKRVILFVNVISFNDAVMSYVMSQCCTCIGHMTIYYKRAANTLVGGVSVSSLVC